MASDVTASTRKAFDRLSADIHRIFGSRFVALVAYGANASVVFTSGIGAEDLDAMAPLVETWRHDGLATPLLMTPDEFRRSLDAFPLEYQDILDHHTVIAGTPPFAGVQIQPDDLRRACEIQARAHLIHLRQGWLQSASHDDALIELLVRSAGPFRALLSNVARLHGQPHQSSDELVSFAEATIRLPAPLVRAVLDLELHPESGPALLDRVPEYLAATEQLWNFVDSWRAS
jgi:hypothetical protein